VLLLRENNMKQYIQLTVILCSLLILANWSTQDTSIDGNKPALNFRATIITQNNSTLHVENLLIGGLYEKIQVYDSSITEQMSRATPRLDQDPSEGIGTSISLANIYQILVPEPTVTWYYEKTKATDSQGNPRSYDRMEYIEIVVISNNEQKTSHRYLIDARKKIKCNEVNEKNAKQIPFHAITQLTITEYSPQNADGRGVQHMCNPAPKKTVSLE
jgi:hypothetical protein